MQYFGDACLTEGLMNKMFYILHPFLAGKWWRALKGNNGPCTIYIYIHIYIYTHLQHKLQAGRHRQAQLAPKANQELRDCTTMVLSWG